MLADSTRTPPSMDGAALQRLRSTSHGAVLLPEDAAYEAARRLWNGMIDVQPAVIAQCANLGDVVAAVRFAAAHALPVAVRGGGHNVAGNALVGGGLVVDLSAMRAIKVDPELRLAAAQGGATIGDLDRATQQHDLATPMGVVTATGIAGLTLGGGYGWLRNLYGLSCDNLVRAQVVLADGEVVVTSETEHPELLWALRGGGGGLGVVTEFTYRLHPIGPDVAMVFAFHDGRGAKMREAIVHFLDFCREAPDEVSSLAAVGKFPPNPEHVPVELHHVPFVVMGAMYAGDPARGQEALRALQEYGPALVDHSGIMPYLSAQQLFDADYPDGWRYYWKSLNLDRLDGEALDLFIEHARRQPSPYSTTDIWPVGGAMKRYGPAHAAFHGRQAAYLINPEANWIEAADDEANMTWARDFVAAMQPWSDGTRYLNFAGFHEEGEGVLRNSLGPQWERFMRVKARYDPAGLFQSRRGGTAGA